MPDIKVVNNMAKNIFHMASDGDMSVRNESSNDDAISDEKVHALFEGKELHCWTASSLVSLQLQTKIHPGIRGV